MSKQREFEMNMNKNKQHGDQINSSTHQNGNNFYQRRQSDDYEARFSDDDDMSDVEIYTQNGGIASIHLTLAQ